MENYKSVREIAPSKVLDIVDIIAIQDVAVKQSQKQKSARRPPRENSDEFLAWKNSGPMETCDIINGMRVFIYKFDACDHAMVLQVIEDYYLLT